LIRDVRGEVQRTWLSFEFTGLGGLTFLWPPLASYLSPYILVPCVLGEGSLTLSLLVKGVNVSKWEESAGFLRSRRA